ncbi:MAG: VWA containing CoxE family protein [Roseiflexaceae bacterium]
MEQAALHKALLLHVFVQLQRCGVALGVDELLAALRAVDGGLGATPAALKDVMILLWCRREQDEQLLEAILTTITTPLTDVIRKDEPGLPLEIDDRPPPPPESLRLPETQQAISQVEKARDEWALILLKTPLVENNALFDYTDWPISRSFMAYAWQRLCLPLPGSGEDEVDITATVKQVAHWGFFLKPVYRQRQSYRTHLLLFMDQDGSMVPFHQFMRDLLASARQAIGPEYVEVSYFHNAPMNQIYTDSYLAKGKALDAVLDTCSRNTTVLVVSDAGAARRFYSPARIHTTKQFLARVRQHTNLVSWLNPLPEERWPSTSAGIIARLVPMVALNPHGLSQAIDMAREQFPYDSW